MKTNFNFNNNNNIDNDIVLLYQSARNTNNYQDLHNLRVLAYNNNWLSQIETHYPIEVIKKTIGRKGCNFIKKTEQNNLLSIWYDSNSNVIEFWGNDYNNRLNAIFAIQNNLNRNLYYHNQKQINNQPSSMK